MSYCQYQPGSGHRGPACSLSIVPFSIVHSQELMSINFCRSSFCLVEFWKRIFNHKHQGLNRSPLDFCYPDVFIFHKMSRNPS